MLASHKCTSSALLAALCLASLAGRPSESSKTSDDELAEIFWMEGLTVGQTYELLRNYRLPLAQRLADLYDKFTESSDCHLQPLDTLTLKAEQAAGPLRAYLRHCESLRQLRCTGAGQEPKRALPGERGLKRALSGAEQPGGSERLVELLRPYELDGRVFQLLRMNNVHDGSLCRGFWRALKLDERRGEFGEWSQPLLNYYNERALKIKQNCRELGAKLAQEFGATIERLSEHSADARLVKRLVLEARKLRKIPNDVSRSGRFVLEPARLKASFGDSASYWAAGAQWPSVQEACLQYRRSVAKSTSLAALSHVDLIPLLAYEHALFFEALYVCEAIRARYKQDTDAKVVEIELGTEISPMLDEAAYGQFKYLVDYSNAFNGNYVVLSDEP